MLNNQRVFHCQARLSGLPVLGTVQKELQRFYGCSPALLESNSMCRSSSSWRIRRLGLAAMLDPGRQALNLGIPNLCVVYNPKLRKSNGWFRGTPISGNLHMSLVSWFFHAPTWRPCHLWGLEHDFPLRILYWLGDSQGWVTRGWGWYIHSVEPAKSQQKIPKNLWWNPHIPPCLITKKNLF